jgi:uncharacterized membrane protein YkvI
MSVPTPWSRAHHHPALPARLTTLLLLLIVVVSAAGCAAIGGIFKAGVWAGVIMAVLVIAVVFFLVRSVSR